MVESNILNFIYVVQSTWTTFVVCWMVAIDVLGTPALMPSHIEHSWMLPASMQGTGMWHMGGASQK